MKKTAKLPVSWSRFLTWCMFILYPSFIVMMVSLFIYQF